MYAQTDLPNRIPQPPPYNTQETQFFPHPFEADWEGVNDPGTCSNCHSRIYDEWNGSMMSNSWRDPGWRGAFLLIARLTAKDGNCDTPNPPDGTARAHINPFADGTNCTSTFDIGVSSHQTSGSGSLLDGFCSRCHMPTNYADNINNVIIDQPSGLEHGELDPNFDPTSDDGTGLAYATLTSQIRNTESGKRGIFCEVCHAIAETRYTPYHNYQKSGTEYFPTPGSGGRGALLPPGQADMQNVADANSPNLGYGIGAGSYRFSPHAIGYPERFGPLSAGDFSSTLDPYVSDVFDINFFFQQGDFSGKHDGFQQIMFERAEFCAACHDVTNPLTIKNTEGKWVGGFPIERTYTEWAGSRYADRPGNSNFDPAFKRDCQTCHMQQDFGRPGTAQTLYDGGGLPVEPLSDVTCKSGPVRPVFYSHHFIGGNAYVPQVIGADLTSQGSVHPYPELSTFSYSSEDSSSLYYNAYWENVTDRGPPTHHARMAWDRLRNVLDLSLSGPASAAAGSNAAIDITVANSGSGHNFPTGFPEGRNAWVAVRAWDLATGDQLEIFDSFWNRTSLGVGYLSQSSEVDPNFPGCNWVIPAGSADPYSRQFKAIASLGDGCPTLDLPYATALNLVTDANGLPIDSGGLVIDRDNPLGLPQFTDLDGDGDLFDDSYLADWRLRPMPHADATVDLDRYSVVIPAGTAGPVAVTAAVYYQSFEAIVAKKFLGNMADTDTDFLLEPCTLNGACDGRTPTLEPAVVEGSPPVPMEVSNWVINVTGVTDSTAPSATTYPANGALDTYIDTIPKAFFSEPVTGVDETTFTLVDGGGITVPSSVSQIGDGAWALFPDPIFLEGRTDYTATIAAGICDYNNNCTTQDIVWTFTTARTAEEGVGDTSVPLGFPANGGGPGGDTEGPTVVTVNPADGQNNVDVNSNVVVTFSEAVMNVTASTFLLNQDGGAGNCSTLGASVAGTITGNAGDDVWTFDPNAPLQNNRTVYCVTVTTGVTDLAGNPLNDGANDFTSSFRTKKN
ncbi:MAG TPA: Ig-like domain-containing protein [Acidobacteriota bacterium]|nr:Ig-like domain-containing protein [Acidobacteriota bacterium]